jgi:glutamate racemase
MKNKEEEAIVLDQAIGVIDSGVGGLTVVQELMRQLPKEKLIYLGDTMRCPYGPRPKKEVQRFTWQMVRFLLEKNIKMLVVACNTATAFTLEELRERLPIPVIGVIQPGARSAIKATESGYVGIIGTEGTIRSGAYPDALMRIKSDIQVTVLACPLFVPMVEQGILTGNQAEQVIEETLHPLKMKHGMDTLILGCTHYPLIKETISKMLGEHVTLISSSEETAREASTVLDVHELLHKGNSVPEHAFYTTGDLELFTKISRRIFKQSEFRCLTIKNARID